MYFKYFIIKFLGEPILRLFETLFEFLFSSNRVCFSICLIDRIFHKLVYCSRIHRWIFFFALFGFLFR